MRGTINRSHNIINHLLTIYDIAIMHSRRLRLTQTLATTKHSVAHRYRILATQSDDAQSSTGRGCRSYNSIILVVNHNLLSLNTQTLTDA